MHLETSVSIKRWQSSKRRWQVVNNIVVSHNADFCWASSHVENTSHRCPLLHSAPWEQAIDERAHDVNRHKSVARSWCSWFGLPMDCTNWIENYTNWKYTSINLIKNQFKIHQIELKIVAIDSSWCKTQLIQVGEADFAKLVAPRDDARKPTICRRRFGATRLCGPEGST